MLQRDAHTGWESEDAFLHWVAAVPAPRDDLPGWHDGINQTIRNCSEREFVSERDNE